MPPAHLTAAPWHQANIQFHPGDHPEQILASALAPRLDRLEQEGTISGWWFIRKPPGCRIRLRDAATVTVGHVLDTAVGDGTIAGWKPAIYEPETTAFGGPVGMAAAHDLFCADTSGILGYLRHDSPPVGRRETSILLISAMLAAAGLDWFERGDVFARVAAMRPAVPYGTSAQQQQLTGQLRSLLAVTSPDALPVFAHDGPAPYAAPWMTAFKDTAHRLADAAEHGTLRRGLRAVLAHTVIFHWNRLGLDAAAQALLSQAATEACLPKD